MLGFVLAVIAGISLGLLGGGGSILTVPILVYIFNIDSKVSVAISLAIVGFSSLVGVISHYRNKNIIFRTAFLFGGFAIPGTILGAYLSQYISGEIQLSIFSVIMILASVFMFKGSKEVSSSNTKRHYSFILVSGFGIGIITGLIGVGGGFLIVPSLMLFANLDIKKAVGTSLLIISFNSLIGFVSYLNIVEIPWKLLINFSLCSGLGVIIGAKLIGCIPQRYLKKAFAVFLIIMGIFILYKNIY